ncbi:MAG: hypothetical protein J7L56_03320 [Halomonas sp.]|nr:hypothetical protein [Halomonas sp.]MCD6437281.1 hypothetical protein [Halomonas sp.]
MAVVNYHVKEPQWVFAVSHSQPTMTDEVGSLAQGFDIDRYAANKNTAAF